MEDQAIRDGFAHLEPSSKYDALYEAALCRERADWIVGMNATRLFSCLYHQTLNVGRVMTPTLAMVVMRDAEIAAFVPQPFYTVQLGMDGITVASRRFEDKEDAQEVLAKCKESIRKFLVSGIMVDEEYKESVIGTPQGGNLSPLLANIMLNELDKEMEQRGLNFVRYADDCIINLYVRLLHREVCYLLS